MIKPSPGGGFQVKSLSGKNLSRPGLSRGQAEKRLEQVEYFKKHNRQHSDRANGL
jgi:hypothetical protein